MKEHKESDERNGGKVNNKGYDWGLNTTKKGRKYRKEEEQEDREEGRKGKER